ncbi:MAG TPA: aminoacyl-tRNA hydrolase [Candidatus Acidoferrum sp.]|nr:aminoacyl-tRNA hydrolase [Candidatus Acidoferrum sp.]
MTVVAGLGNPGPRYQGTRHNVGQRVLDHLAPTLRAGWRDEGWALVARGRWRDEPVHLVKPQSFMNVTGPAIATALRRLHAEGADLIMVYDDIDLALGAVRMRMKGSHGGHNGMRSVIETLGTDEIRRVKVGIGRPERKADVADHVLDRFQPEEVTLIEDAVALAADRVLQLITQAIR